MSSLAVVETRRTGRPGAHTVTWTRVNLGSAWTGGRLREGSETRSSSVRRHFLSRQGESSSSRDYWPTQAEAFLEFTTRAWIGQLHRRESPTALACKILPRAYALLPDVAATRLGGGWVL